MPGRTVGWSAYPHSAAVPGHCQQASGRPRERPNRLAHFDANLASETAFDAPHAVEPPQADEVDEEVNKFEPASVCRAMPRSHGKTCAPSWLRLKEFFEHAAFGTGQVTPEEGGDGRSHVDILDATEFGAGLDAPAPSDEGGIHFGIAREIAVMSLVSLGQGHF